ncbi:MAG: PaaI family thioesterase, partial [Acidimicrobiales bacterium]|nr:PaaI family thioesterase [Acidimicrobiales bacterium]
MPSPESLPEGYFPFQDLLGFNVESRDGRVVVELDVEDRHHNPNGVVHGAVVHALMDTA